MASINGTTGNDVITGTTLDDVIFGDAGDDRINGGSGNDTVYGGVGKDTLTGDAGNDALYGGDGNDGFFGGGGNDAAYGEAGDDVMYGDGGDDVLYGGDGTDTLIGGTGNDILYGGAGANTLTGGGGADTFVIELTSAALTAAVRADLATLKSFMDGQLAAAGSMTALSAQTTSSTLNLPALGLTISGIETVRIFIDGVETPIVSLINRAPFVADTSSIATDEDSPVAGQVAAVDPDGDTLGYAVSQGPAHGTLTLDAATGAYTYTPGANYNGADSFKVAVTDPSGLAVVQTVTVGVNAVNDAPVADAAAVISTDEDTAVSGQVVASDIDGDTLGYAVSTGPAHGTLTLDAATGAYTYAPGANFNGSDSFSVAIVDPSGASVIQTVTVGVAAVNDAPVTVATGAVATSEDKSVSGTIVASDVDGDTLAFAVSTGPAHGSLALDAATGAYTYTPGANFSGADTFDVTVTDASGATAMQRVSVSVSAVADQPTLAVVNPVIAPAGVVLAGLSTNDTIGGTAGADTISGNGGNDSLNGGGSTTITAGLDITSQLVDLDGSETLSIKISNVPAGGVLSAGTANGDGTWTLSPADLAGLKVTATVTGGFTVHVEATATEASGQTSSVTANIDVLLSPDANVIFGGAGNDRIIGGSGDDKLYGGSGNDTIFGNGGNDAIYGGKGNDIISGGDGDNLLRGDSNDDLFYADAGNDTIIGGTGFDTVDYSAAMSAITVDLSMKTIAGVTTGNDTVSGMEKVVGTSFADTFKGSSANDIIVGGGGNDWLRGIAGNDTLTGGAGNDIFFWEKADVVDSKGKSLGLDHITDFGGGDVLDLTKLVALGTKPLSDFVKITDKAAGSTVSANIGGKFVDVAVLDDFHGKTATDLFHDGFLLIG